MPTPLVTVQPNYPWANKHRNVSRTAARLYTPWNRYESGEDPGPHSWRLGLAGLQRIIAEGVKAHRRVRPVGGSWSLSEIAATSDFLIDTGALNSIQVGLDPAYCIPAEANNAGHFVFAQCGAAVWELNRLIEGAGLSFKTSGASNGQSIAGAIATGTHGSANSIGSMQEFICGFHILREDGSHVWLERQSRPVVSDAFVALLGATLRRDDEMFRAAMVGLGAFGLVHAVLFEVEPRYLLERYIRIRDVDDVRKALHTLDVGSLGLPDGDALPFHFEVVINPYAAGRGQGGARLRFMYKRPYVDLPPAGGGGAVITPSDDLLGAIGLLGDLVPAAIPTAVAHVIDLELKPVEKVLGTHGQTFGSTTIQGAGMSMEIAVPVAQAEVALDVILQVAQRAPFGGLLGIRYVKPTDALMGFTRFGPTTCTLELPSVYGNRTTAAFETILEELESQRVTHTLHWGQCLPVGYTASRVASEYGSDRADWTSQRNELLKTPDGRWMFSNDVIERCGLG